ncbi:branched-chain amino acid ABC transporter substrate-binding protein [soil metagenome]
MKKLLTAFALGALFVAPAAYAQKGETVRIAFIDPLSGAFANVGANQLKSWQYVAEQLSGAKNPAGVTFEVTGFDNKGSPQESLNALRAATDQGFRYVTQGNGSGAALAILEAVAKHNERNPGKEIVYLSYSAKDPALTNEKCNYWHFRLDADTTVRMEAVAAFMKDQPKIKKVFLINQNYSHGQQTSRFFKEDIARQRPDVQIVGDEMIPIGTVKDFSPYVSKIKASGADTIMSSNWGSDLTLLVKALNDAGLKIAMYTNDALVSGTPTALAAGGDSEVYVISPNHSNHVGEVGAISAGFKKKFNDDYYMYTSYNGLVLLSDAMAKSKSTDPVKVAAAMEGMTIKSFAGEASMRKSDHQMQQAMFISKWQKVDKNNAYSVENTGYTFAPVKRIEPYVASTPTSCAMKRPS